MTSDLKKIYLMNLFYGIFALILILQVYPSLEVTNAALSCAAGWGLALFNFELLKRLFQILVLAQSCSRKGRLMQLYMYMLFILKLSFLGLVISVFFLFKKLVPIPFMIGSLTILMSGLGYGVQLMRQGYREQ